MDAIDPEERADFVYEAAVYTRASDGIQVIRRDWILGDQPENFPTFVSIVVMNFKDGLGNVVQDTGVVGIDATCIREAFEKVDAARAEAKKAMIQRRATPMPTAATEQDLAKIEKNRPPFKIPP